MGRVTSRLRAVVMVVKVVNVVNVVGSLLLLLSCATTLEARGIVSGWAQRGGQQVTVNGLKSTTKHPRSFPSAAITVYKSGTTTKATIYSTNAGATLANPFSADSTSYYQFFTDEVTVDLLISGSGVASYTLTNTIPSSLGGGGLTLNVTDFGAKCDSTTDDTVALTAALTAGATSGATISFPRGVCMVSSELSIPISAIGMRVSGVGIANGSLSLASVIRASVPMRSVLAVLAPYQDIQGIAFDANNLATYATFVNNGAESRFFRTWHVQAVEDGIYLDATGNNDGIKFDTVWCTSNGSKYRTAGLATRYPAGNRVTTISGTATSVAGNSTITIAAGTDLTTLGVRKGDWVYLSGTVPQWCQISSVTSTTIVTTAFHKPYVSAAGVDYALLSGDGYHETRQGDNNIGIFTGGLFRGNAASGMALAGLFGPTITGPQCDLNGAFGVTIGYADGATPLNGLTLIDPYFEANGLGTVFVGAVFRGFIQVGKDAGVYQTNSNLTWAPGQIYDTASVVQPTVINGFSYMPTAGGISGTVEPVWPVVGGSTIVDGTLTWTCIPLSSGWQASSGFTEIVDTKFLINGQERLVTGNANGLTQTATYTNFTHANLRIGAGQQFQSFVVNITNVTGTLKVTFGTEIINYHAPRPILIGRIVSATNTALTLPINLDAANGFGTVGAGVAPAEPYKLVFNTDDQTPEGALPITGSAVVEYNTTGTALNAALVAQNININGATRQRLALYLSDNTGTTFNINTTNITAGKGISIRVNAWIY